MSIIYFNFCFLCILLEAATLFESPKQSTGEITDSRKSSRWIVRLIMIL